MELTKAVDQTDKEAEYYRNMVVAQGEEIEILRNNVKELQGNLQKSYKRIEELNQKVTNFRIQLNIQDHWESQDRPWQENH
jgi:uncharacterized coiled-coil DUF342 family protein